MSAQRQLAPVALFAYKRPEHLDRVLSALAANDLASATNLIVFSEAPRDESERENVERVRRRLGEVDGFRSIEIHERPTHAGLSRSIVRGVTHVIERFGQAIVLEDDHVTSPFFLRYMNDALDVYADDDRVIGVSGYRVPFPGRLPETYFRRGADCAGWGTWSRGWRLYEPDAGRLLEEIVGSGMRRSFDLGGAYPYTHLLRAQVRGEIDSWGIRWQAAAHLGRRFTLYPGRTLLVNIGFDGSGANSGELPGFGSEESLSRTPVVVERIEVSERRDVARLHRRYYRQLARTWRSPGRRFSPRRVYRGVSRRLLPS